MYEIVVGRDEEDRKAFGNRGTFMIGKHYVKMGQTTSLSTAIYMDVLRSHVVSVFGKRGSGKSYTISAIAEGMLGLEPEFTRNLSVVMFDTMGIFWTMKYENRKDERLLREWGIQYQRFNLRIYAPFGSFAEYKDRGIPVDLPFSISPSELSASDWCSIFGIDPTSELGALIGRVVPGMRKQLKSFSVQDIINSVRKDERTRDEVKAAVENMFYSTDEWGLFGEKSTPVSDLAIGGQITVIDLSPYAVAGGKSNIRALVIGLVSKKLFNERMLVRKTEEMESLKRATSFTRASAEAKKEVPLIWLVVDEAHEFLPRHGTTPASNALITVLREGRQPGISLVLASQQPGQIHTDVMTQSDTVISHRVTAKIDVDALGTLMQSYMREGLDKSLDDLPRVKGAALLFDDTNERLYPMRVRPKATWHGGSSPSLVAEVKSILEF
ncbi:ATP-binding protein [Candidatus Woesearchaeota archaeon]|nr:ATP-binding protein [Candidatus Woesearchaeota archaeon]